MAKSKSRATILVADGPNRMTRVEDRRFDKGKWPINLTVPANLADFWLRYLSAECEQRDWPVQSLTQMYAKENSGSITVKANVTGQAQITIIWERKPGGPMNVRARTSPGTSPLTPKDVSDLFDRCTLLCASGIRKPFYVTGSLQYDGLPWKGELWLSDRLRLGPPTKQDETMLLSSRIILVDALVDGIDQTDAHSVFQVALRELAVFLSIVMNKEVRLPPPRYREWTYDVSTTGDVSCDLRIIGYIEQIQRSSMPTVHEVPDVPLRTVNGLSDPLAFCITSADREQWLQADVQELWARFNALSSSRKRQFLQAGNLWHAALALGSQFATTQFSLTVAACEALKPEGRQYDGIGFYDVVQALLDKSIAQSIRQKWAPQSTRSAHLHRGTLKGAEFAKHEVMSSFQDPTFDWAHSELHHIVREAILEWLRRDGVETMSTIERKGGLRRWTKRNALWLLPVVALVGIAAGFGLHFLLAPL